MPQQWVRYLGAFAAGVLVASICAVGVWIRPRGRDNVFVVKCRFDFERDDPFQMANIHGLVEPGTEVRLHQIRVDTAYMSLNFRMPVHRLNECLRKAEPLD